MLTIRLSREAYDAIDTSCQRVTDELSLNNLSVSVCKVVYDSRYGAGEGVLIFIPGWEANRVLGRAR